jgi:hypothetical protein
VEKDAHSVQTYGIDDTVSMELKESNYDRVQQEGLLYHRGLPRTAGSVVRVVVRDASIGAVGNITAPLTQ